MLGSIRCDIVSSRRVCHYQNHVPFSAVQLVYKISATRQTLLSAAVGCCKTEEL
jgi:hypothetical protein